MENQDFELDLGELSGEAELPEAETPVEEPTKPKTRRSRKKTPETQAAPAKKKEPWPIIVVEQVEGRPNYELVAVNGHEYQIKRGVKVTVPPAVAHVLENAVETHYRKVVNPISGREELEAFEAAGIPWRVVGYEER